MTDAYLTLRMNLSLEAPEGAGWYVYAVGENTPLIPASRIAPQTAIRLAGAFEQALRGQMPPDSPTPTQLVISGNALIRQKLAEQLEYAEDQARRIAQLRQAVASYEEISQASGIVQSPPKEE